MDSRTANRQLAPKAADSIACPRKCRPAGNESRSRTAGVPSPAQASLAVRIPAFLSGFTAVAMFWGAAVHSADAPRQGGHVEILHFADRPVTVVRGGAPGAAPGMTPAAGRETVSFGNGA